METDNYMGTIGTNKGHSIEMRSGKASTAFGIIKKPFHSRGVTLDTRGLAGLRDFRQHEAQTFRNQTLNKQTAIETIED